MKIFAISDLHLSKENEKPMDIFGYSWVNYIEEIETDWKARVTDEDVVLLCGDLSWAMKLEDITSALEFLTKLPGKKIIIKGNHDYWWKSISSVRAKLPANMFAIQNDAIKLNGVIFSGTRGWTVPERNFQSNEDRKILMREVTRLEMSLNCALELKENNEKIICLIHYPPFNSKRENNKFINLFEKYNVHAVVYGHLHGDCGRTDKIFIKNGINYYLTSCDQIENKLVEIEV